MIAFSFYLPEWGPGYGRDDVMMIEVALEKHP